MKVRREIASVPLRTAGETWQAIVDLITGDGSIDAGTLKTAAFVSDKMRNLMKILVQYHRLDPTALMDAWSDWVDRAARMWLESEHLQKFIIEFYKPGTTVALARWDFPIRYDGNGVDEMWI